MRSKKINKVKKKHSTSKPLTKKDCGCSKHDRKDKCKNNGNREIRKETKNLSEKTIQKNLSKSICRKRVKKIGDKRATTVFNQGATKVSGGGDGFEIDSLGVVTGPDIRLGQASITETLYNDRVTINETTICGYTRVYSCVRNVPGRRFCRYVRTDFDRCNWTTSGIMAISAEITIPSIFTDLYNSNSNVKSCIADKTEVIKDYILNNIGSTRQLSNRFLRNNLTRIQIEAELKYQAQVSSCLQSFLGTDNAKALANGLRVRSRVRFLSFSNWQKV